MKKLFITFFTLFLAAGILGFLVLWLGPGQSSKMYRIGLLVRGAGYDSAVVGYKEKMAELGYQEGKNVVYDTRLIAAKDTLPLVVREFIEDGVDLIHTYSTPATQAAYAETKDLENPIPVVFGSVGDPLISGVINDTQRPGTNVTGVASLSTELTAKRLELLQRIDPGIERVAMPHTVEDAGDVAANKSVDIAKEAAQDLGIELVFFPVASVDENAGVARRIRAADVDGIVLGGDSLVWSGIDAYVEQARQEKLPLAVFSVTQIQKGALVGFGPDYRVSGEQAAGITHQIFRGKDPAVIPIEVPDRLMVVINADTAEEIGVSFSDMFMQDVDLIIEEGEASSQ